MKLSAPSRRLYDAIAGFAVSDGPSVSLPTASGPTLVKVEDPAVDVDEVIGIIEELTPEGRMANGWLRRRKRKLALTQEGDVALEGRVCCMELARKIDRVVYRLTLPSEHTCTECGTKWRVEMRVREERRHGAG